MIYNEKIVESKLLSQFQNIKHGFITRKNNYASFNEYLSNVEEMIGKKNFLIEQIHSENIVVVDENNRDCNIKGDAIITNIVNFSIMVKSSDCVPIIIYCKDINYIAIIHSGWKGVLQNIVGQVIDKLINLNAKCDNIYIAIGPCIAQEFYEVKKDLFIKFIEKSEKNAEFFISINDKIYFSLYAKINEQILEKNIINSNIDYLNIDTFTSNNFTSYRKLSLNDSASKCVPLNFISFIFLKDILDKSLNKE